MARRPYPQKTRPGLRPPDRSPEVNSRERALTDQTTLDVTRYARLWRLTWWTQHVAWPLAVFGAGVILLAFVWQALGQLDGWEKYIANKISLRPQFTEAEREYLRALAVALFRLAREGAGPGLPWAATMAAALLFELVAYLLGCGRFRLPLLSLSLAALIVTAAVALLGIDYALKLAPDGEAMFAPERPVNAQTLYDQGIFTIAVLACASLPLLTLRGIAILLLWRHRLRPDLPRTQRMTRSLGVNLTIPQFAWPHPSLVGFAVHACILLVSGTLAYLFWGWITDALIFGSVNLFFFVFDTPIILLDILFKFLTGSPLGLANDWATFLRSIDQLPQLLLLVGVFFLARALWRVGRRLNLRRRNEIILRDKPPVLLLRSFTDDVDVIPSNLLIQRLFWRRKRLEEIIGEQLTRAGPFVAIGKPGERLPQLGANRLYLGDSEWQTVVQSYISRSDLIIVIAGKTHWVRWELANVLGRDRIAGLLIVFPRITEADRNERWQNLKPAFCDTSWSAAVERVDIARALAMFIAADRGIVVVKSRNANESDYETALRVATYLMRQSLPPA
jgi:hypothetical protein